MKDNKYKALKYWGIVINQLSKYFNLTLIAYLGESLPSFHKLGDLIDLDESIEVISLGIKPNKYYKILLNIFSFKILKKIRKYKYDYLFIEYPTPLAIYLLTITRSEKLITELAGDIAAIMKLTNQNWLKTKLAIFSKFIYITFANLRGSYYLNEYAISPIGVHPKFNFYPLIKYALPYNMSPYNEKDILDRKIYVKDKIYFERKVRLITFCRLDLEKGTMEVPLIIKELKKLKVYFEWHIIGTGPNEEFLKQTIYQSGFNDNCKFFDWMSKEELSSHISTYLPEIFVELPAPSCYGPGRSPQEAMSYGIPCIFGLTSRNNYFKHLKNSLVPNSNSAYDFALSISQYSVLTNEQKTLIREEAYLIAKKRTVEKEIIRLVQALNIGI